MQDAHEAAQAKQLEEDQVLTQDEIDEQNHDMEYDN